MQHKYVGDIGDYIKLAILRALRPGRRLGIAWWLHPEDGAAGDGRHISYLAHPAQWRCYDPVVFDHLAVVIRGQNRNVSALTPVLAEALCHSEMVPVSCPAQERPQRRSTWFSNLDRFLSDCDLVFLDPDNGLQPEGYRSRGKKAGKSVTWHELQALKRPGRCVIVYHHQTRRRGGHVGEMHHLAARLHQLGFARVHALRARSYSPRLFFILDPDVHVRSRAEALSQKWGGLIEWHPDL